MRFSGDAKLIAASIFFSTGLKTLEDSWANVERLIAAAAALDKERG